MNLDTILLGIIASIMVVEFIERNIGILLMLKGLSALSKVPPITPDQAKDEIYVRSGGFQQN